MRPELLKPLRDIIADGHDVRRRAAAAISSIERTGSAAQKQALTDFFSDAGVKAGGVPPVILPDDNARVDSFTQYPLLANLPPYTSLGVQLTAQIAGTTLSGFSLGGTGAYVQKNASLPVLNSAGASTSVNATVSVTLNAASDVKLPATAAILSNSGSVFVRNSAGGGQTATGTAVVASGVLTGINLAATTAILASATKIVVPVTGTFVNGLTATIVNGTITGVVLS